MILDKYDIANMKWIVHSGNKSNNEYLKINGRMINIIFKTSCILSLLPGLCKSVEAESCNSPDYLSGCLALTILLLGIKLTTQSKD